MADDDAPSLPVGLIAVVVLLAVIGLLWLVQWVTGFLLSVVKLAILVAVIGGVASYLASRKARS